MPRLIDNEPVGARPARFSGPAPGHRVGMPSSSLSAWTLMPRNSAASVRSSHGYANDMPIPLAIARLLRLMVRLKLRPEDVK
jgi:hypothetical protein